ncbi:MAG: serine phosphatase RsbU (regulator of sigma subunit) [Saprospiraceae bacterium]|jgi:serine phosphatase RsbU (regulator of sigma subunit)
MVRKLYVYFFFTLICSSTLWGQKNKSIVDSLKLVISSSIKDSNLVRNHLLLSKALFDINIKASSANANKAHRISKQLFYLSGNAESLLLLGLIDFKQGKLHLALNHLKQALTLFNKQNNKNKVAQTHTEMGNIYAALGNMVKAIENHQQAIKYFTETNYDKGVADSYSNLGQTHFFQKNYSTALRYYKKSKLIYQRDSNQIPMAELYNRISLVFRELNKLDKSLEYDYLALMTQEKLRDKQGIANSNYNIGKTSVLQGELKRATGYIEYAEKLFDELEDNLGLAKCYLLTAKISISKKRYSKASADLSKAILISREREAIKELSEAYYLRSKISEYQNDYKSAYLYLTQHANLKDTLFSKEKTRQFSEMQVKYQSQSKDDLLVQVKQEKKEGNNNFILYVLLSAVVFLLLAYSIYLMKKKTKAIYHANLNIEKSSELIKIRNKEIIDSISYAKKIQDAILPPQKVLDNIFTDHFISYHAKDIVSGDFYWAHKDTAANKVFWASADCTGHGVPGALMSVIGTIILNEIVIVRHQHSPEQILNSLSKYLKRYLNKNKNDVSQDGIELSLCVLDHDDQTLEFSGANRNVLIIRNGEIIELKGNKRPIGFDPFNRETSLFTKEILPYQKGDCIYTFSDGYTDQIGGVKKQKYRVGVLKQDLIEMHELPMGKQKSLIETNQKKWMRGNTQLDDILVFGVKV